ncbi:hypothetical protein BDR22DRAFT_818075 [Usnea florida]
MRGTQAPRLLQQAIDVSLTRLGGDNEQDGQSHVFEVITDERDVDGKVAVRCHGHMAIPAASEEELHRCFEVYAWDRPEDNVKMPESQRQPFRAMVMDLVENDRPFSEKTLTRMRKDLLKMPRLGVYPKDVRERNYRGGLLLDFSIAITKPLWVFEKKQPWWIRPLRNDDSNMLQVIMLESGAKMWQRAVRNRENAKRVNMSRDRESRERSTCRTIVEHHACTFLPCCTKTWACQIPSYFALAALGCFETDLCYPATFITGCMTKFTMYHIRSRLLHCLSR